MGEKPSVLRRTHRSKDQMQRHWDIEVQSVVVGHVYDKKLRHHEYVGPGKQKQCTRREKHDKECAKTTSGVASKGSKRKRERQKIKLNHGLQSER